MRKYLKAILVGLAFVAGLAAVTLLFPGARLLGHRVSEAVRGRITVLWYRSVARLLNLRIRCFGELMPTPGLVVSNHVSWLDIVALGSQAPLDFIAKREVADWPVVGYLGRRTGTLFVRRGDSHSTRSTAEEMVWRLKRGRRLALFPEGTSSSGEGVLHFHPRLFQPALMANLPVQAVAIAYRGAARPVAPFVGDDAFLPHLWRLLALERIDVDLIPCPPLTPGRFDRNALAQQTRAQILSALELQAPPLTLSA
ncbi:lysophospholipid acyltransferase family protein [Candidatus Methylocalor cossyra]|uniref:lysophospholipid acyltransferase family protein n=1 Tax=Candidatus Methylocalor cossyra TaxID=3108543 RepID=UPI0032B2D8FE